jgi:hypothetical protein
MTTLLAAALIAALLILRDNRGAPRGSDVTAAPNPSTSEMTTSPPTARPSVTAPHAQPSLSGTDAQRFIGYSGAGCDPGSVPAVMGRTTQSLIVVCEVRPASYTTAVSGSATVPALNWPTRCGLQADSMSLTQLIEPAIR